MQNRLSFTCGQLLKPDLLAHLRDHVLDEDALPDGAPERRPLLLLRQLRLAGTAGYRVS